MAAVKKSPTTKLIIKVANGTSSSGTTLYASRTFQHINPAATDDNMLSLGNKYGALQSRTVGGVQRQDLATLESA